MEAPYAFTVGKNFYEGSLVPAAVLRGDSPEAWNAALASGDGLKVLFLAADGAVVRLGAEHCAVMAPCLVFLPRGGDVELTSRSRTSEDRIAIFHPRFIRDALDWDSAFSSEIRDPDVYLLRQLSPDALLRDRIFPLEPGLCRLVGSLMDRMEDNLVRQEDPYWPCRSRSFLLQILIISTQLRERNLQGSNFIPLAPSELIPIQICLLQNLDAEISVQTVARYFNTNRTSLQAMFKEHTGMSVKQYLIRLRLQTAEILLRNTYLTLAEIAERTGFSDEAGFVKAFKKLMRMPPGEFRKAFVFPRYLSGC